MNAIGEVSIVCVCVLLIRIFSVAPAGFALSTSPAAEQQHDWPVLQQ